MSSTFWRNSNFSPSQLSLSSSNWTHLISTSSLPLAISSRPKTSLLISICRASISVSLVATASIRSSFSDSPILAALLWVSSSSPIRLLFSSASFTRAFSFSSAAVISSRSTSFSWRAPISSSASARTFSNSAIRFLSAPLTTILLLLDCRVSILFSRISSFFAIFSTMTFLSSSISSTLASSNIFSSLDLLFKVETSSSSLPTISLSSWFLLPISSLLLSNLLLASWRLSTLAFAPSRRIRASSLSFLHPLCSLLQFSWRFLSSCLVSSSWSKVSFPLAARLALAKPTAWVLALMTSSFSFRLSSKSQTFLLKWAICSFCSSILLSFAETSSLKS